MKDFSNILIEWYHRQKRDLPWRDTIDPYHVWLSEIMLQQTRVEQGLPYYNKFLKLFPTIYDLAETSEQEVLSAWKGLGYYSRARRLHATAKIIVDNYEGKFPKSFLELKTLPGIGDYTAAAIASFCFKEVVPVVDGNVYRLLSRMYGVHTPIDTGVGRKEFHELASSLIDPNQPDTFNQAMMEFGALQCTPKKVECGECPFVESCEAFHLKKIDKLPVKVKKIKRIKRYFTYLINKNEGKYLINKRGEKGIWANMFEFPLVETSQEVRDFHELTDHKLFELSFDFELSSTSSYKKHVLTHQDIYYTFWIVTLKGTKGEGFEYQNVEGLNSLPFPKLLENYISNL